MTEDLMGVGKIVDSVSQPVQKFLGTIFGSASEEFGEILADNVKFMRWKNSLRILEKAQAEIELRGLRPKEVPLKTLMPILEGASLEGESENLQDKWSNLLTSAASGGDSHPSYPKILSEIVYSEAKILDYLHSLELRISSRRAEINELSEKYNKIEGDRSIWLQKKQEVIDSHDIPRDGFRLSKIMGLLSLERDEFSQSIDNILRLKLAEHPEYTSEIDVIVSASLTNKYDGLRKIKTSTVDKDGYELDTDEESIINRVIDRNSIRLTRLGVSFMRACQSPS